MRTPLELVRLSGAERRKALLLCLWFSLTITTLWVLKPVRSASLLAHLGAGELPYVRFGTVLVVGGVVALYSRAVDRMTRVSVARNAHWLFAAVLLLFWVALTLGGAELGGRRLFVWSVFILVDIYSTVMVGVFWTYANDVVSPDEADRLYGPIGIGGTLGGVAGGLMVDSLVGVTGTVNLLLLTAGLCLLSAGIVSRCEGVIDPEPRAVVHARGAGLTGASEGLQTVLRSRYLLLIVGVVISYEFAAVLTDFVVNVVFERAFSNEVLLARMFGRLGWIASVIALVSQVLLVPLALPHKRFALLVPPLTMAAATAGLAVLPGVAMAIVLSAADRGLNYSLQQAAKETLYVPLTDTQKYKGKAVIDMFVDRLGKAIAAAALIAVTATAGLSIRGLLIAALAAIAVWAACASAIGRYYARALTPPARRAAQMARAGFSGDSPW